MTVAVRRGYVDVPHGQVHLRVAGSADAATPPLLCLHMSPASGLVYEQFMAHIGESRQVIAMDTPGFGASDPLPAHPEIADYARVVAQVIEALGLSAPVDVMGYHTGSFTALELSRLRPDLVRRVVAVSLPLFTEEELVDFRALYDTAPIFTPDGTRLLERWRWFVDFFRVGTVNTVEHAARIFHARLSGGERHWWGHRAAFAYDVVAAAGQVDVPMLVINPDDDLRQHTPRIMPYLRNATLFDASDWTHGFLDTHSSEAARLVAGFLDAPAP
ncbi:alpha/beta fold hydrolase [Aeromicrobium wangtongii]|uniref:alpha/beta fold hydrolase n=1 Tax=Aeromicrobium wangtongii TaxID=2969247 RepID=UPI0020178ACE|nr:alpha/beta hydrolase [Aeromicrobium wangtongii]MCL3819624.1 alpha/beta hydrolase [Aeromicrobium wangtongii]